MNRQHAATETTLYVQRYCERLENQGSHMHILSARHVKTEESLRLGVVSGWYSTKVSGTFVTGPHTTQEDCLSKILELNPPPAKKKF
jgi:hypothetical protein